MLLAFSIRYYFRGSVQLHDKWYYVTKSRGHRNRQRMLRLRGLANVTIVDVSPYGDTASSSRLYDALACGCVPVIISDPFVGAFPHDVPYETFVGRTPLYACHIWGGLDVKQAIIVVIQFESQRQGFSSHRSSHCLRPLQPLT